jgi:hypothetical protein
VGELNILKKMGLVLLVMIQVLLGVGGVIVLIVGVAGVGCALYIDEWLTRGYRDDGKYY